MSRPAAGVSGARPPSRDNAFSPLGGCHIHASAVKLIRDQGRIFRPVPGGS